MAKFNLESIIRQFMYEQAKKESQEAHAKKIKRAQMMQVQSEAFDKDGKFPAKKKIKTGKPDDKSKDFREPDEDDEENQDVGKSYDPRISDDEHKDEDNKKKNFDGKSRFEPDGGKDGDEDQKKFGRFKDNENDEDDNLNQKDNENDEDDEENPDDPKNRFLKNKKNKCGKGCDDEEEIDGSGEKTKVDLHPKLNTDQKSDQMTVESNNRFIKNRKKKIPRTSGYPGSTYSTNGY